MSSVVQATPKYKTLKLGLPPLWLHQGRSGVVALNGTNQPLGYSNHQPNLEPNFRCETKPFLSKHFIANQAEVSTRRPQSTANTSVRPAFKWEALFTDPLGVSHLQHHRGSPYLMTEGSIIPLFCIPVTGAQSSESPGARVGSFICHFH